MALPRLLWAWIAVVCSGTSAASWAAAARLEEPWSSGPFSWGASPPLLAAADRPEDPCYSVKDPSVVRFDNRWHLFCTIRSVKRSHQIEYSSFEDWPQARSAERHVLRLTNGYFCAPQVFFFAPQRQWYLIHQVLDTNRPVALQPAYSTTAHLADPDSWSSPRFLYPSHPPGVESWIDFWIICDEFHAHLFFTSNNGKLWRAQTTLAEFPLGWSVPAVVLRADIFEASHTYRLRDSGKYVTLVESVGPGGRRYYKAYLADRLDGDWKSLADTFEKPFAAPGNVRFDGAAWTDSFSHGELLRAGYDQRLEIQPTPLRFLFQGVSDTARAGKKYGEIPWQLGLLESAARP